MADSDFMKREYSRRDFIAGFGGFGLGALLGGVAIGDMKGKPVTAQTVPPAKGYLVVDTKKCAGCETCMLMCSLVHHGKENLSLSRIQIEIDPYGKFPNDMTQYQCRQCPFPACVEACPTGAMHVDTANGNIRTVDPDKCIGCERCINACPFEPSRVLWNNEEKHAQKCDLCANTPYWSEDGGFDGKQACVESCPMHAIKLVKEIPAQTGDMGYQVNLRTPEGWGVLGFPVDDAGKVIGDNTMPVEKGMEVGHPAGKKSYF